VFGGFVAFFHRFEGWAWFLRIQSIQLARRGSLAQTVQLFGQVPQ